MTALHEWLADGGRAAPLILDVREPWETVICQLAQARLLPMQEIPSRWNELPHDRDIVVLCHHGMRSLQVANYLIQSGEFADVVNLQGGIDAWSQQVDRSVPLY